MIIAVLVFGAWGAWFALARVPLYESSANTHLTRDGNVIAQFEPNAFARVRPGQNATVVDAVTGEARRAEVLDIANRAENRLEPNTVRLYVYGSKTLEQPPRQVQIQVADESPLFSLLKLGSNTIKSQTENVNR